jgi:hypothetical protein
LDALGTVPGVSSATKNLIAIAEFANQLPEKDLLMAKAA